MLLPNIATFRAASGEAPLRSRLAPTPSGFLHIGNGVNFVITWLLVRRAGGSLRLRIDDADSERCRREYVEDIFRQLDWLGLDWDEGPVGVEDFLRNHSQRLRRECYRAVMTRLRERGHAYACACSRRELRARAGSAVYPGFCRRKNLADDGQAAIRLLVPEGTLIQVQGRDLPLATMMGDFVLWRRDDRPAYQLTSLADDLADRINCIVRGEDLLASTAAQLYMARCLGEAEFSCVSFLHHELLASAAGDKLSKSDQALSLQLMRDHGARPSTVHQAAALYLGIDPREIHGPRELLQASFDLSPPLTRLSAARSNTMAPRGIH